MLVAAIASLFVIDWAFALVGLAVFPALFVLNVIYSRQMAPRMAQAQALRAQTSAIAHESFDGALVVKAMGREAEETERFAERARALRDAMIRVGRLRGLFDPLLDALPNLGTLAVLVVGGAAAARGRGQRRRHRQRLVPLHRAGVPGPGDRLGAHRGAAQRGRLRADRSGS